ncbi:MAG: universal stress protein [Gammaproteobacteria bacterium]|jgi:nucleotide-binding universal stress UspA family protein|nr:universal stress protein [Gammaproteobacteria bacterium]
MSNKLLVALDGSDGGRRALHAAVEHASLTGADLVLTYVIEWTPYSFHTPQELEERHQRRESEIERANESVLASEREVVISAGLKVETVVRHGKIAETLVNLAREHDVSQIYIGRRGESLVHSMIFGSVTASLIQTAEVPVTVVP